MCSEYPCSQLYIMLAIAIALLGVSASFKKEGGSSGWRIALPAVFVFITLSDLASASSATDAEKASMHSLSVFFLFISVLQVVYLVASEHWERERKKREEQMRQQPAT